LVFQNAVHKFFSDCENSIAKHKIYHVLFWLLYASLTASVIRIGNSWFDSFQRQLPIVATHALAVYVNLYILLPKLLLIVLAVQVAAAHSSWRIAVWWRGMGILLWVKRLIRGPLH
jgi:hypothetical protein